MNGCMPMAEYEKKVRDILKQYGCHLVRWDDGKIKSRHTANSSHNALVWQSVKIYKILDMG